MLDHKYQFPVKLQGYSSQFCLHPIASQLLELPCMQLLTRNMYDYFHFQNLFTLDHIYQFPVKLQGYSLQFCLHPVASLLLELLQLHCQAHVALDLELALEEGLLGVQLAGHQVHEVIVLQGQGHVGFGWQ